MDKDWELGKDCSRGGCHGAQRGANVGGRLWNGVRDVKGELRGGGCRGHDATAGEQRKSLGCGLFLAWANRHAGVVVKTYLITLKIQVIVTPILNLGVQTLTLSTVTITTRYTHMPTDPIMKQHTKVALTATKTLHKRLRELEEAPHVVIDGDPFPKVDYQSLKKLAADANKAIVAMQRHASDDAVRADVRENILREAVRDELIDREANAARVHDRQRALFEGRDSNTLTVLSLIHI